MEKGNNDDDDHDDDGNNNTYTSTGAHTVDTFVYWEKGKKKRKNQRKTDTLWEGGKERKRAITTHAYVHAVLSSEQYQKAVLYTNEIEMEIQLLNGCIT